MQGDASLLSKFRAPIVVGAALVIFSAWTKGQEPTLVKNSTVAESKAIQQAGSPTEVVVYASDLPKSALYEFDFINEPASPGGKMVGTPNNGDLLDPPPENDPHVIFKVKVQAGVPYRCWIRMKVGAPKGKSKANLLWLQISEAVDKANKELYKPGSESYMIAQGPPQPGWMWVRFDVANAKSPEPSLLYFRNGGEVTVRVQAGMEGVGFDQFLLSPAKFLEQPPTVVVVNK